MALDPKNFTLANQRQGTQQPLFDDQGRATFSLPQSRDVNVSVVLQRNFEALSTLSDQISRNLGGVGSLLEGNIRRMDRMANSAQRYSDITREDVQHNKQILEFSEAQERAKERIREAEDKYRKSREAGAKIDQGALVAQLKLGDMLNKQGKIRYIDPRTGRAGTPLTIDEYMRMQDRDQEPIRQQMIQQAGLAAPQGFSPRQALQALSRGDIGGALGELAQTMPGLGRAARGVEGFGAAIGGAGVERQASGQLLRGLGMRGVGAGLGLLGEFGFSPAALYFGGRMALSQYQQARGAGMQTGMSGFGAAKEGFGAQFKAIGEGLNPFDALSMGAARAIARGIQSEGFSGAIRSQWQDTVTDLVKSTGMDSSEALQLMSTAVNNFGESAQGFHTDMTMMKETANQTNLSVKAAAESMQAFQTAVAQQSGTQGAIASRVGIATLQRAAPRAFARPGSTGGAAIQQNWVRLVTQAGYNPAEAYTPQIRAKMNKIVDTNVRTLWGFKNSNPAWQKMTLANWVPLMEGYSPGLFDQYIGPGLRAQDIIDIMNAVGNPSQGKGYGLETKGQGVRKEQTKIKSDLQYKPPKGMSMAGGIITYNQKLTDVDHLRQASKDDNLTPEQVKKLVSPIWATSSVAGAHNAYLHSREILKQMEAHNKKIGKGTTPFRGGGTPGDHSGGMPAYGLGPSMTPHVKVTVDGTPWLKKHLTHTTTTEPAQAQKYFDSRRGQTGTQGSVRP